MLQQQVQLETPSQIMREMAHGWLHTIIDGRGYWVTKARLTRGHLYLTVGIGSQSREVPWSPTMAVWTII